MASLSKKSELFSPQERLQFLLENTKEYAIIVMDFKGNIEDWNEGAKQLIGFKENEIVGKNFSIFFTPEDRKAKKPQLELEKAKIEGKAEDDNWVLRKDNSKFWASGLTVRILDKVGNMVGFAKIIRDQTDRKELDQQKDDFISIASHEIRNPLTVTFSYQQLLQAHLKKVGDKEGLKYITEMMKAIEQLNHLVADLLNVSKLQFNNPDYQKEIFSLGELVREVVKNVQKTTTHKISVKGSLKERVLAYRPQIREVITNLLTNAIKYSPNAKSVLVTLKRSNDFAEISVRDYGIGIDKKSLSRIYSRFYRTPLSRKKNIPGIGLGLYITKMILENHQGSIRVESSLGKGSLFSISLPLYKIGSNPT